MTSLLCETLLWLRISFGSQQNVFTVRENSAKRTVGVGVGEINPWGVEGWGEETA